MEERGAREADVLAALRLGEREPAQRGLVQYRFNVEFKRQWDGRYYGVQQSRSWTRNRSASSS
jgi:hypothetical protein